MGTDSVFSRSGTSHPLGKCTEELKTVVPEDVKEKFVALAQLSGQSSSEYLRDVITAHLYGQFHVLRMKATGARPEVQE